MSKESTTASCCTSLYSEPSSFNPLAAATSFPNFTTHLAKLAAASLVTASAGLGACYAWGVGIEHGAVLGILFVLFAVGLEVAKPLSVIAAFRAFGSWQLVRGAGLAVLAVVAIAYSLTAELTLMAGTRGDLVAERQNTITTAATTEADAVRARERYDTAKIELATLAPTRPAAEVEAEIAGLLLTPGADGCTAINGKITREVCPKVASLRIEKARADRRAELEAILAAPLPAIAVTPNVHPQSSGKSVRDADPGASALATYLAAMGLVLPVKVLTDWLALVPVIALELGSALAGVLVQAVSWPTQRVASQIRRSEEVYEPIQPGAAAPVGHVGHPKQIAASDDVGREAERVKQAILGQLKERGEVEASQRGLAALIGTSRPTVRRAISALMIAGMVVAEATRNGTVLRPVT